MNVYTVRWLSIAGVLAAFLVFSFCANWPVTPLFGAGFGIALIMVVATWDGPRNKRHRQQQTPTDRRHPRKDRY